MIENNQDFVRWVRRNLINKHYLFDDIDLGYGVLTGEKEAEEYFVIGIKEIKKGEFLLLATDGVIESGLEELEKIIKDSKLNFEKKLPFAFKRVLNVLQMRGEKNDDMTGILVKL